VANPTIYVGALAPEGITVTIDPPEGVNANVLQTCTGVTLKAKRAGGTLQSWPAQIITRTPLVVEYQFLTGDVDTAADYVIVPTLTVQGGTIRAEAFTLTVTDPFP
jgi:hypothetical protein